MKNGNNATYHFIKSMALTIQMKSYGDAINHGIWAGNRKGVENTNYKFWSCYGDHWRNKKKKRNEIKIEDLHNTHEAYELKVIEKQW